MKKLFYFLFSIIFIIFLSPKVYAYSSDTTYYDVSVPEIPSLLTDYVDSSSSMTYYDFFEHLIDIYNNSSYNRRNFVISFGISGSSPNTIHNISIKIFLDDAITYGVVSYGVNNSGYFGFHIKTTQDYHYRQYEISSSNKPLDIKSDVTYLNIVSCISGLSCSSSEYKQLPFVGIGNNGSISNNSDRTVDFLSIPSNNVSSYFYYSSKPITLDPYDSSSSYSKKLKINGIEYGYNSLIPSYKDLYIPSNTSRDPDIGNIYVGGISKANINSFKYSASFYYDDYNYVSTLVPHFLFFARRPHDGYYSYHQISCTTDTYSSIAINTDLKKVNMTLLPNGFSCSGDLSVYDNIYLNIYFTHSLSETSIIGYYATSNYGNIARLSDTQASYLGVYIYEVFPNLSYDFSYVLSTSRPETKAYYISDNSYVTMSLVRNYDNYVEGASYNPIIFGQDILRNAIVYNLKNYYTGSTYLQLFINYDTIISGQINGSYYYYNSEGVIENNIITPRNPKNNSGQYDTSHYNNIVTEYISTLSNDIFSFSQLTQEAFDTAPSFIQLLIYVSFILFCLHFIMKLIRK